MLERFADSIITGVISGSLVLIIEYWTGWFNKRSNESGQGQAGSTFAKVISNSRFFIYFALIVLAVLVWVSNFVFFRVISPTFLNVAVATATFLIIVVLLGRKFLSTRSFAQKLYLHIPRGLIFLSPLLFLLTVYSAYAGPDYVIIVLPITNGGQVGTDVAQRVEQYLTSAEYSYIAVREFDCLGDCPLPASFFVDSRVLLVVSGDYELNESGASTLQLRISANCRRDPSPIDRKFVSRSDCAFSNDFPYENWTNPSFLDVYLPILLLNSMAQAGDTSNLQIGLVNQAIAALDNDILLGDKELAWELHEKLFYDILYNLPNLSLKERIDSTGEVRARAAKFPDVDNRLALLTARWYEESGAINSDDYERALIKYQEIVLKQRDHAYALSRLSSVSEQLYRYSDAICYLSEALKLRPNNEDQLRLASLHDKLGIPLVPNDRDEAEQTPQEIRSDIQAETTAYPDASSIQEYFNLAEISLNNGNYEDALDYVDKILRSSNLVSAEEAGAHYLEGRIRYAQSDFDNAIKAYKRFLDIASWERFSIDNLVTGYSGIGLAYHSRGFHSESAASYQKALNFVILPEKRAALLAQLAEQHKLAGQMNTSETHFQASKDEFEKLNLESYPLAVQIDYHQLLYNYAFIVTEQAERERYFKDVANFYSGLIEDINQKASKDAEGCTWISQNLYQEAEQPYEYLKGYAGEPYIPVSYFINRGNANYQLGNSDDVRRDAQNTIEHLEESAQDAIDFYNLALAYAANGDDLSAIGAFQQAIDLDNPGMEGDIADATDYYGQGLAYTRLHSYTLAIQALTTASELQTRGDPIAAVHYYGTLADTARLWAMESGDSEKLQTAIDADYHALELDVPNEIKAQTWFSIGLSHLAWSEYDAAHYSEAINAWKKAIELDNPSETALGIDPADAEDWSRIGHTYYNWGKVSKNEAYFLNSVNAYMNALKAHTSENPKAVVWYNIGRTYLTWAQLDASHYPDAIDAWTKAIELDNPEDTEQGTDAADAADWSYIGDAYRAWAISSENLTLFQPSIDAYENALKLRSQENVMAIDWFDIGLTYFEWSRYDPLHYPDAIDAWKKAIELDNPDDTERGIDTADAADWSYIGDAYRAWALARDNTSLFHQAIDAYMNALHLRDDGEAKARDWFDIGLTYFEWSKYDAMHYSEAIDAWTKAIELDNPEETALNADLADAEDWSYIGDTYRAWGIENGNLTLFSQAISAHMNAIDLRQSDNLKAGDWYDIGLTYLAWSNFDESHFPDAVQAWMEAIYLDNPEETRNGTDTRDIADWHMLAVTYRDWSTIDKTKLSQAIESLDRALAIPIHPNENDYHWHQAAQELREELEASK